MTIEAPKYALTLWRPWTALMIPNASGAGAPKAIENRSWEAPDWILGKRIAIHAGKRFDDEGWAKAKRILCGTKDAHLVLDDDFWVRASVTMAIVGTAVVRRSITFSDDPWFFGAYGWVLEDRRPLKAPVPCRGAQRLWIIGADARAAIAGQLAEEP